VTNLVYSSCAELPLFNWIELCVTGDLKWLAKSGEPDNLSETYLAIADEYSEVSKDQNATHMLSLKKQIAILNNKLVCTHLAVEHLRTIRNEEVISILRNNLGFASLKYDNLDKDLDRTVSLSKSMLAKLQVLEKQLQEQANKKGGEITREAYYSEVAIISKWLGFQIQPKNYSLLEYIVAKNAFKAAESNGR
jgi:hypothetical protein